MYSGYKKYRYNVVLIIALTYFVVDIEIAAVVGREARRLKIHLKMFEKIFCRPRELTFKKVTKYLRSFCTGGGY